MLTSSQIRSFVRDGFVVVPSALDRGLVDALANLAWRRITRNLVTYSRGTAVDPIIEEEWDGTVHSSVDAIAAIASQLLPCRDVYSFELMTRRFDAQPAMVRPRIDGFESYIDGEHDLAGIPPYLLLVGVALHPLVHIAEGWVHAIRGGHRATQAHFESNPLPSGRGRPKPIAEVASLFEPVLQGKFDDIPLQAGDAFIASPLVPYGVGENSTPEERTIAWIRFGLAEPGLTTRGISVTDYPGIDVL